MACNECHHREDQHVGYCLDCDGQCSGVPTPVSGYCPKHRTVNDSCGTCDADEVAALKAALAAAEARAEALEADRNLWFERAAARNHGAACVDWLRRAETAEAEVARLTSLQAKWAVAHVNLLAAEAQRDALAEALRELMDAVFRREGEGPSEAYDRIAAQFRTETGLWPPGKDAPVGSHYDPAESHQAWNRWCVARAEKAETRARAALASSRADGGAK
jgi:hypothetical protein